MNVSAMTNPVWSLNDWCNFYGALNSRNSLGSVEYSPPAALVSMPLDTIGESARNRFGRPYISGRPLLACDRKRIIEMYAKGARKITIARTIGVTHSCVSKVIRRFEESGFIDNKGSRTASCACPGEADAHDPTICRHVKFRNEQNSGTTKNLKSQLANYSPKLVPKPFSIEWILSSECCSSKLKQLTDPALNRLV